MNVSGQRSLVVMELGVSTTVCMSQDTTPPWRMLRLLMFYSLLSSEDGDPLASSALAHFHALDIVGWSRSFG